MNPSPTPSLPSGIRLSGLAKSFGTVQAVRHVDLTIAPGEVVAVLGPNGAGKSTTIDLLLGLARPDAGSVSVFGRTPRQAVDAGEVGAMLQVGEVIRDLTVGELVQMMAALYPDPLPVGDVLELAGITDLARRRTQKLSGGQTQRVRFAVAVVANPSLLVLDEPTVGMDVESRRAFWASMRAFAGLGRTVVFATHYLEEADAFADRIVLMADGRVVADGPTTEIKAMVAIRLIRTTLPGVATATIAALPGVVGVDRHGDVVEIRSGDSDATLRALLAGHPDACDLEVRSGGLEEAFLELTSSPEPPEPPGPPEPSSADPLEAHR